MFHKKWYDSHQFTKLAINLQILKLGGYSVKLLAVEDKSR